MRTSRALIAANPLRFGRARAFVLAAPSDKAPSVSEELRLFAANFAAGFVFVSILLA